MVPEETRLETSVRFHFLIIRTTINAKNSQAVLSVIEKILAYLQHDEVCKRRTTMQPQTT